MGWSFPWASSFGGDFNYDFNASFTEEQQRSGNVDYNYSKGNVSSRENEIAASEPTPEAGAKIRGGRGHRLGDVRGRLPA